MIEELNVLLRKQTPTPPNEWLYQDYTEEGKVKRDFKPFVYLGKNAEPWPECTEKERLDWYRDHPEHAERVQTPDEGFDWLYKDQEGEPRMFRKEVGLPPEAEPWGQCTDAEKVAWEEEHKQPDVQASES